MRSGPFARVGTLKGSESKSLLTERRKLQAADDLNADELGLSEAFRV